MGVDYTTWIVQMTLDQAGMNVYSEEEDEFYSTVVAVTTRTTEEEEEEEVRSTRDADN